ncbi:MAG: Verru_Chthon cassette protein A [Verrucomicrobiota bacterium]
MKSLRTFFRDARRHRGLALIIVLSMLALATIVMLAFLSVADTEHKGTMGYSASQSARRLADTAVNIVIGQIRGGTDQDANDGREFHATQPGAVRKYTQDGAFLAGYKLFSDSEMIYRGIGASDGNAAAFDEYNFVKNSEPVLDWNRNANSVRYVDLNEPVIKGVANAQGDVGSAQVFFPIIDPRAAYDMDPGTGANPVEGFQYSTSTALSGAKLDSEDSANNVPIVVPPADLDRLRLAMPVQWLYMLKDGTVGTLDANLKFIGPNGTLASSDNPLVARLAFWTDDETCKINVNTASEPTFQGRPTYFHERDHRWADYPAARGEYQRFSGHPATVAMSSVLYPNAAQQADRDMETYGKTAGSAALRRVMSVKNRIYEVVPRLATGGSEGGTKLFAADTYNSGGSAGLTTDVVLTDALNERLYASMDELIFSGVGGGTTRARTNVTIDGGQLFTKSTLERASAFLSAHSRASEINMLGLPRIAMWPISTNVANRTGFDKLIAFCSTIGTGTSANQYIFQRDNSRDPYSDINNIARNRALLGMLDKVLATAVFPANSVTGGVGKTFKSKMRSAGGKDNYRQVIVEMFDYIRSTNLYDSFLIPNDRNSWPTFVSTGGEGVNWEQTYKRRDDLISATKTFTSSIARNPNSGTNSRGNTYIEDAFNDRALPGHGQVTPIIWNAGGQDYRGFGRSISISEIGLQFICTADGQPDMYSWRNPVLDTESSDADTTVYKIPEIAMILEDNSNIAQANMVQLEQETALGKISGGRTALKVQNISDRYLIEHYTPEGFGAYSFSNSKTQHWADQGQASPRMLKARYYSNYPPNPPDGSYNTESGMETAENRGRQKKYHPGFEPKNWNYTLEDGQDPLQPNQKRVQAMIHLEFFCPSVGYTTIFPEFTVVVRGDKLQSIEADSVQGFQGIFPDSDVILKSSSPIYEVDGTPQVGGYCSFRRLSRGRFLPARGSMPPDQGYVSGQSGNIHNGLVNMDLVSNFFTIFADKTMEFRSNGAIRIDIYNTHDYERSSPVQTIYFRIPPGRAPAPDLVVQPTHMEQWVDASGIEYAHPTVQAPHWWAFHRGGALGRDTTPDLALVGRLANTQGALRNRDGDTAATGASNRLEETRQRLPGTTALIYGFDNTGNYSQAKRHDNSGAGSPNPEDMRKIRFSRIAYGSDTETNPYNRLANHVGSDVVRTLQPGHGDARLIYAKPVVLDSDWSPHPLWDSESAFMAHNFSSYNSGSEVGFDRSGNASLQIQGTPDPTRRSLPQTINMPAIYTPDAPFSGTSSDITPNSVTGSLSPALLAQRYYDFDDVDPGGRVGTFINKADEGNFAVGDYKASNWPQSVEWRASYFRSNSFGANFAAGARSFFTPNRMISSPVMMGSLPSRVFFASKSGIDASNGGNGAWTNLLFRPHNQLAGGALKHPGELETPDHYLLDLFWMPVVEPYAISEPLSTAGKVNMNYQMLPFTHIRRATALHAVMKGEVFAALPNVDYDRARAVREGFGTFGRTAPRFRDETSYGGDNAAKWYRSIVVDRLNRENNAADSQWWIYKAAADRVVGTLRQFEERFNFGGADTGKGPSGVGGDFNVGSAGANFRSGLFRNASQICEVHLIPSRILTAGNRGNVQVKEGAYLFTVNGANSESNENLRAQDLNTPSKRNTAMTNFWNSHAATGDNTREAPYSNLYAKLTTRSNTFRVHVRSQTLKKALRGTDSTKFVPGEDEISGEYRGSFLLERYVDMTDLASAGTKADFTVGNPMSETEHPPLDSYYRFRIIESKRFAP